MRPTAAAVLATAVLLATSSAVAQQPAPPPPAPQPTPAPPQPAPAPPGRPSTREIVPGQALAGIILGQRIQLILARFGRPSVVRETLVDSVYTFSRWGIAVYVKDGVVTAASTSNSLLKISEDLGVGYRAEDVVRMFGRGFQEGTVEGFPGMVYDDRGIAFGLDRQAVAVVIVFRPRTAAQVSGLLPGGAAPPAVASFPHVANLRPYSVETNYFSLPGYLRWVVYHAAGVWITFGEAARVIEEQRAQSR